MCHKTLTYFFFHHYLFISAKKSLKRLNVTLNFICYIDTNVINSYETQFLLYLRKFILSIEADRWLCLTSHRQRGHLETAPPFAVPCEGREARVLHSLHRESNTGSLRGSPLHNRCVTPAPPNRETTIT